MEFRGNTLYSVDDADVVDGKFTVPDGTTEIAAGAFEKCDSLKELVLANSVQSVGDGAYLKCKNLVKVDLVQQDTSTVNIPEGVQVVGDGAFTDRDDINSVQLPESTTEIGYGTFKGCAGIKKIEIPKNVSKIGEEAFAYCKGLVDIDVDENNQKYKSDRGVLLDKHETVLVAYPAGRRESTYEIPSTVKEIGYGAFNSCEGLTRIVIPNTVEKLGRGAFLGCSNLTSVEIEEGVTQIDDYAFCFCSGLTNIKIPNSVKSISPAAFMYCNGLRKVTLPEKFSSSHFLGTSSNVEFIPNTLSEMIEKGEISSQLSTEEQDDLYKKHCEELESKAKTFFVSPEEAKDEETLRVLAEFKKYASNEKQGDNNEKLDGTIDVSDKRGLTYVPVVEGVFDGQDIIYKGSILPYDSPFNTDGSIKVFAVIQTLNGEDTLVVQSLVVRINDLLYFGKIVIEDDRVKSDILKQKEILAVYRDYAKKALEKDKVVFNALLKEGKMTQQQFDESSLKRVGIQENDNDLAILELSGLQESAKEADNPSGEKMYILEGEPIEIVVKVEEPVEEVKPAKEAKPEPQKEESIVLKAEGEEVEQLLGKLEIIENNLFNNGIKYESYYDVAEQYSINPYAMEVIINPGEDWFIVTEDREDDILIADVESPNIVQKKDNLEPTLGEAFLEVFGIADARDKNVSMEDTKGPVKSTIKSMEKAGAIEMEENTDPYEVQDEDSEITMSVNGERFKSFAEDYQRK